MPLHYLAGTGLMKAINFRSQKQWNWWAAAFSVPTPTCLQNIVKWVSAFHPCELRGLSDLCHMSQVAGL